MHFILDSIMTLLFLKPESSSISFVHVNRNESGSVTYGIWLRTDSPLTHKLMV